MWCAEIFLRINHNQSRFRLPYRRHWFGLSKSGRAKTSSHDAARSVFIAGSIIYLFNTPRSRILRARFGSAIGDLEVGA